jgi:hypothetical protein
MLINNVNVSKKDWNAFLCVRQDGQYNMWSIYARRDANLNKETWSAIMKNFDKLIDKWGDLT